MSRARTTTSSSSPATCGSTMWTSPMRRANHPPRHQPFRQARPEAGLSWAATGAGKTTITNLINRFYDVQEGRILYDGIDVKDIKKDDLRRSLVVILQDTHLFSGTIMENIRYGRLNATDEECMQRPSGPMPTTSSCRCRKASRPISPATAAAFLRPAAASEHCPGGSGEASGTHYGRGHLLH